MATFSLVLPRSSGVAAIRNSGACVSEKTEVRVGGDSLVQESIYGASHERHGDGANLFVIQARFEVGCQFNIDVS